MRKNLAIILLIFLLGVFLRVIGLDSVPPSLSNDEVSIAYDAYSVSKTLKDEHNNFLPISFQSHSTYKAPLTIYLAIPSVLLFGNSSFAVRLPSAVLGSLSIVILILVCFELSKNIKLSQLAGFLFAISPWHIFTSRMALESNIALFFVLSGIYCFLKFKENGRWYFAGASQLSFVLSIYAYHTEWIFTPILGLVLLIIYFKEIRKKTFFIWTTISGFLLLPVLVDYLNKSTESTRANTELFIYNGGLFDAIRSSEYNLLQKFLLLFTNFIDSYSGYLSLGHLFGSGLNLPSTINPINQGLFLIVLLPAFLIGFTRLKQYFPKSLMFIVAWVVISPVIPSLTKGGVNYVRNLISVAPYIIVISCGAYFLWEKFNNRFIRGGMVAALVVSFLYFSIFYYIHFPKQSAENFQYGYEQFAYFLKENEDRYKGIVVDPYFGEFHDLFGVPHLYILYYTKYNPANFLKERDDYEKGIRFGKYDIRYINWDGEQLKKDYIYFTPVSNLPKEDIKVKLKELKVIRYPNGKEGFKVYILGVEKN